MNAKLNTIRCWKPAYRRADIKRVKYAESFFNETGDRYYRAKLYFITLDEKSGAEKKTAVNMLVQASALKEAVEIVEAEMKKTMIDYDIASVVETAIMDVFPYGEKSETATVPKQEEVHS